MKTLRIAVPVAAALWLLMCFLPSHTAGEFAAQLGSDAGYVFRLALVALAVFGGPYLIIDRLRRR